LYPQPDHRASSDEDVLIPPSQWELCHQTLTRFGMMTTAGAQAYELPYRKENSPLYIELHQYLFPPEQAAYGDLNRFFTDAHSRAITVTIQGHNIRTLDHTDHLFYLICHAFKHFLHSGFGIRQVCDIILYAGAYGAGLDWQQILENCRAIRAEGFAAAIFAIGRDHLGFDTQKAAYPENWQQIEVDEIPMLLDLLSAGLYGDATIDRKRSSNLTLDAASGKKPSLSRTLFPSRSRLLAQYPYLQRQPYLLPVAWAQRLWRYAQSLKDNRANPAESTRIGKERIALLRRYGLIE
jgi:hypothetical protein